MDECRSVPDPLDVAVGQLVRVKRKALNLSQIKVAELIGVSFQQLQKYENGANRISASMLIRIAAVLETSVGALVGEEPGELKAAEVQLMQPKGAMDLLRTYSDVPETMRPALLNLARSMARAPRGAKAA